MQNHILVALVIFTVAAINVTVSERISDIKCKEYSKIPRDPAVPQPHIVSLRIEKKLYCLVGVLGTLISDQYVLTTERKVFDLVLYTSKAYFLPKEEHSIVEKFIHSKFHKKAKHDFALLRLETKIKLDSHHRPACIWTKDYYETTYAQLTEYNWYNIRKPGDGYEMKTLKIITCTGVNHNNNASLICLKSDEPEDNTYDPSPGSPIQVYRPNSYLPDNHFIYGIFSFSYHSTNRYNMSVGYKTFAHLDYIEPIVWGVSNQKCGRTQIKFKKLSAISQPTFHGELPWHAAIFRSKKSGNRRHICGGSLLNANTILTTALCVSNGAGTILPNLLIVSLGRYDLDTVDLGSRDSLVDRVILHEMFNRNNLQNDVAILKLKTKIVFSRFIQPICMTNELGIFDSNDGVVTSWGCNEIVPTKTSVAIRPYSKCLFCDDDNDFVPLLKNRENLCAGFQKETNICVSDSGSGLVYQLNNQWFVRGIVSYGLSLPNSTCYTSHVVLFTDVVKFFDWITDKL